MNGRILYWCFTKDRKSDGEQFKDIQVVVKRWWAYCKEWMFAEELMTSMGTMSLSQIISEKVISEGGHMIGFILAYWLLVQQPFEVTVALRKEIYAWSSNLWHFTIK